jgi:hypothetical protein
MVYKTFYIVNTNRKTFFHYELISA